MARGDVLLIHFPEAQTQGTEQTGTRPAIAVEADVPGVSLSTLIVVPLTSKTNAQRFAYTFVVDPSPTNGLSMPSVVLCSQMRAISRSRIIRVIGHLEQNHMERLTQEIRRLLGLP